MAEYVGSIDQGTTSSRFMIFDHSGNEVGRHQLEHEQILPQAGWVEHNPVEIWERTSSVIRTAMNAQGLQASDLAALGITNQREARTAAWTRGNFFSRRSLSDSSANARATHVQITASSVLDPPCAHTRTPS